MSDSEYFAYLEKQFSWSSPALSMVTDAAQSISVSLAGIAAVSVRQSLVARDEGFKTATDMLTPTSRLGPVFGLTRRDIERSATRLEAGNPMAYRHEVAKRAFDVIVGLLLVVLTAPLLAVMAILIRAESKGPVFFRQTRIGVGGREFTVLKLRTMRLDGFFGPTVTATVSDGPSGKGDLFAMRTDPLITRVGRVLRRYSIDELPQLFNVLGGSMSLVGPRPPLPSESIYRTAPAIRPGMTGLWAVLGRRELTWEAASRHERDYAQAWSLGNDLTIIAKTLKAIGASRHTS